MRSGGSRLSSCFLLLRKMEWWMSLNSAAFHSVFCLSQGSLALGSLRNDRKYASSCAWYSSSQISMFLLFFFFFFC
ncbi:hypothetical protein BDR26DRAFT_868492 [Obelidium mucronatum]|nr:hypothetical protein BDR26DRAFT_868492 [Obelidium mucronatum]